MSIAKTAWEQYKQAKAQYPHCIIWFRMGDFYETFGDDAAIVARVCGVTLTSRYMGREAAAEQRESSGELAPRHTSNDESTATDAASTGSDGDAGSESPSRGRYPPEERVPLAGVPYHAAESYLARLVAAGYKVAICEQVSEPGRGLVERAVLRVVTAGTVVEPDLLHQRENNYLAALCFDRDGSSSFGLAYVDVTTGEFAVTQVAGPNAADVLESELQRLRPAELLLAEGTSGEKLRDLSFLGHTVEIPPSRFDEDTARELLCRQFGVRTLEGFGCASLPLAIGAAGAILSYLAETNRALLPLLTGLYTYSTDAFMTLDTVTRRNLELVRPGRQFGAIQRPRRRGLPDGAHRGTLLGVLDVTATPMGGRLLRRYLGQPLRDLTAIRRRHDAVEAFVVDSALRSAVRSQLAAIGATDLERITGRIAQGNASARDLLALRNALHVVARLKEVIEASASTALAEIARRLDACTDVGSAIGRAIADDTSGRLIRRGYRRELDELLISIEQSRQALAELERTERDRTGIKSLKIGYNKVFGYYIEVTRANRALVPDDYTCRQTLVGGDRFVIPRLKELEANILAAETRIADLEREIFGDLLRRLAAQTPRLLATADAVAQIDVLASFAEVAVRHRYVRPVVDESNRLVLIGCRHPVVEATHGADRFIPNDCDLDGDERQIVLLTGPNMAGKSTYLRQVALCVLLAQVGAFVPAEAATIGLVDRIFTRVGAQDDIAGGASTFMVEMAETAAILRHATRRSLIVLDEVGRGTATHDGLAIARAIVEHIHDEIGARALFATHFGELTALAEALPRLRNYHAEVDDDGERIVFLYRIAPGGADRSYGVHVAQLAGLPRSVVARAEALLRAAEFRPPGSAVGSGTAALNGIPRQIAESAVRYGSGAADPPGHPEATGDTPLQALAHRAATDPEASSSERLEVSDEHPEIVRELLAVDIASTTPIEALNKLFALQQRARGKQP